MRNAIVAFIINEAGQECLVTKIVMNFDDATYHEVCNNVKDFSDVYLVFCYFKYNAVAICLDPFEVHGDMSNAKVLVAVTNVIQKYDLEGHSSRR